MALESKINVRKSKSAALKKGLTKDKNGLIQFLQADETWQRIMEVAGEYTGDSSPKGRLLHSC